jgi:hypothetical protein
MIDNPTNIVLGSLRYKGSSDTNLFVNIPLEQTEKEIVEFDRNVDLSLQQVFDDERQSSTIFRPVTKYTFLFKNEYIGSATYVPFRDNLYYTNEINNAISYATNSSTPWEGYPQYTEFDFIRLDNNIQGYTQPPNNHITFINKSASTYNWTHYVSYPYSNDYNKPLFAVDPNTSLSWFWVASDGIPFTIISGSDDLGNYITFKCPMKHGILVGEYVEFPFDYDGETIFQVNSLGDSGFGSEEYIFKINNVGFTGTTFQNGVSSTFKRVINKGNTNETRSKYYIRKHKILTNSDCALLIKAGFEQNIFESKSKFERDVLTPNNVNRTSVKEGNQSYTLSFNCDIDINPLRDNQNRPITELFFTTIWKGYFGWTKGMKQGWEFNQPLDGGVPNSWWDQGNFLSNTTITESQYNSNTQPPVGPFYYNEDLVSGDTIDGDYCEWNDYDQIERVISRYVHKIVYNDLKFNIETDALPSNEFGYYYNPHNSIILRQYSDYIEEAEAGLVFGVPDYAFYSNLSNSFRWRDLYTYGYIDSTGIGVNYPFMNNKHYPYVNTIFRLTPEGIGVQNINDIAEPTVDECE